VRGVRRIGERAAGARSYGEPAGRPTAWHLPAIRSI